LTLGEALKRIQERDRQFYTIYSRRVSNASREEVEEAFRQLYGPLSEMGYPLEHILSLAEDYAKYSKIDPNLDRAKLLIERVSRPAQGYVECKVTRLERDGDRWKLYAVTEDGQLVTRVFDDSVSDKWARDRREFLASVAHDLNELLKLLRGEEIDLSGRVFLGRLKVTIVNGFEKTVIESFRRKEV